MSSPQEAFPANENEQDAVAPGDIVADSTDNLPEKEKLDQAISDALDGYAKDGDTWVKARDEFFRALEMGKTPGEALEVALDFAKDGAESGLTEASDRFWGRVHAPEVDHSESYSEAIESTTKHITSLLELPSTTTLEENGERLDSYRPAPESSWSIDRYTDLETDAKSYVITYRLRGVTDPTDYYYSWVEGDTAVRYETIGPEHTQGILSKDEGTYRLEQYDFLMRLAIGRETPKESSNSETPSQGAVERLKKFGKGILGRNSQQN